MSNVVRLAAAVAALFIDFDKEYVKYEAKDHKEDVEDQSKEMKATSNPDLKKFASAAHDTVSKHKEIVDELHRTLGGK